MMDERAVASDWYIRYVLYIGTGDWEAGPRLYRYEVFAFRRNRPVTQYPVIIVIRGETYRNCDRGMKF